MMFRNAKWKSQVSKQNNSDPFYIKSTHSCAQITVLKGLGHYTVHNNQVGGIRNKSTFSPKCDVQFYLDTTMKPPNKLSS